MDLWFIMEINSRGGGVSQRDIMMELRHKGGDRVHLGLHTGNTLAALPLHHDKPRTPNPENSSHDFC